MATENTVSTLNGWFKELYVEKEVDVIPEGLFLYNEISFVKGDKQLGNLFHAPIVLQMEHGFTYGGPNGDAFNLNEAIAGAIKDATVQGYEMVLRSKVSVGAVSRCSSKGSFGNITKHIYANMMKSFARRIEIQMLYGQSSTGLGEISAVAGNVLTISAATWASGIFAGAEGMPIDIYTGAVLTQATTITAVNMADRKITVAAAGAAAAADVIYFKGAYGNEFLGIDAMITSSGTVFGISNATYSLWKGNELAVGGAISLAQVEKGVVKAMEKGLMDQDVVCLVHPSQWEILLTEQNAKRQYDSSFSETVKSGGKKIEFFGANGMIKVVPSTYVKHGEAFLLPVEEFQRIGSRDITFDMPGFEGQFFRLLDGANGYELRAYTDQALFCTALGKLVKLSGLT